MREGIHHQIHGIIQSHHKTSHIWIRDSDRLTIHHLLYPQRDHRATARHNVTITGTANSSLCVLSQSTTLSNSNLLHHRFRDPHGVDRIGSLIGRKHHHIFHTMSDSGKQHVICTLHVRTHSLHREEFTTRNLLKGSGREHIIHTSHSEIHRFTLANITNIKFHLMSYLRTLCLQEMTHIILFLLISREDTNLLNVAI